MLTEQMFKGWFPGIRNFHIDVLLNQYAQEKIKKSSLEEAKNAGIGGGNYIFNKITENLNEYDRKNRLSDYQKLKLDGSWKMKLMKETIRLKVILDLIKDLDYNY